MLIFSYPYKHDPGEHRTRAQSKKVREVIPGSKATLDLLGGGREGVLVEPKKKSVREIVLEKAKATHQHA